MNDLNIHVHQLQVLCSYVLRSGLVREAKYAPECPQVRLNGVSTPTIQPLGPLRGAGALCVKEQIKAVNTNKAWQESLASTID